MKPSFRPNDFTFIYRQPRKTKLLMGHTRYNSFYIDWKCFEQASLSYCLPYLSVQSHALFRFNKSAAIDSLVSKGLDERRQELTKHDLEPR